MKSGFPPQQSYSPVAEARSTLISMNAFGGVSQRRILQASAKLSFIPSTNIRSSLAAQHTPFARH